MANTTEEQKSYALVWLKGVCNRIYAITNMEENIRRGFPSHIFMMRVSGIWPMANDSRWYKWLTIAYFLFAGILFPLSLFVNIFYDISIESAMGQCFTALVCGGGAFKTGVMYWQRKSIRDLFRIHAGLLRDVVGHHTASYDRIARMNVRLHTILGTLYAGSWCNCFMQSLFYAPDRRLFASTLYLPYEFARNHAVFSTLLMYQLVFSLLINLWLSTQDILPVALINITCFHVTQLKERLRTLGSEVDDLMYYKGLVECCQRYDDCLR